MSRSDPVLSVRELRVGFDGVDVVRGVSFDVHPAEVLALVGESGAGKSLTARAVLGMLPKGATVAGEVLLAGAPVTPGDWGRRVALVPQDALSALSPVHPVREQLALALRSVQGLARKEARERAEAALAEVGVPATAFRAHPHALSGGMRQRAVLAMALVNEPDLVVTDEPTTALDPETRETVLRLLRERCAARGASLVLVTHDLDVVRAHADRMVVMYGGAVVEYGPAERVLTRPLAPYTAGLLASLPTPDTVPRSRLPALPGRPPTPGELPDGCPFAPRCARASVRCSTERPAPRTLDGREVACHHVTLETA